MSPYKRVLTLVGGAALMASLTIGIVFLETNAGAASLHRDEAAAHQVQALGDELLTQVHEQRVALAEYLMSGDARPLAHYSQAVMDAARTSEEIRTGLGDLAGIAELLAGVAAENEAWRTNIAEPAIAAVVSGSADRIQAAVQQEILAQEKNQEATSLFIRQVDAVELSLSERSDALNLLRVEATALGVVIELLAAGLSLWFVRRYGLRVMNEARRRTQSSAERVEIIASLRNLRTQETPEATSFMIATALQRLPGIDVAGVIECSADGARALAIVGLRGFPLQTGESLPPAHARYLIERSSLGPWAERIVRPSDSNAYHDRLLGLGVKSRAFAPIRADGELIALIAIATTDEDHARHLLEDLPAVGEFASVAETILAPALAARRDRVDHQRRIAALISGDAFKPVFQPIIEISSGTIVGFEALTRFDDGSRPDVTFAAARSCGMGMKLETVTLERAIDQARVLPEGVFLSLNVSPTLLAQGDILYRLLADASRPIVLEVTEHEAIDAYSPLREAMLRLGPGVRLAVDDAGAGVANFSHLVELHPDYVKIDASLVRGVDADPRRRAVVVGLIHFAAEAGCDVIAEGIETEAERATVAGLGVTLGQGFLLARPAPAETWAVTADAVEPPRPIRVRRLSVVPLALPS